MKKRIFPLVLALTLSLSLSAPAFASGNKLDEYAREWFNGEHNEPHDWPSNFQNGFAVLREGEKCGVVNSSGETVIPFEYDGIEILEDGYFSVVKGNAWGIVYKTGAEVLPCEYDSIWGRGFYDDLIAVSQFGKYGYCDRNGNMVISPQYDHAEDFVGGLAKVGQDASQDTYYSGVVDRNGDIVIEIGEYIIRGILQNGRIVAGESSKYGVINQNGRVVVPFIYENAYPVDRDSTLIKVESDEKWGLIDSDGQEVLPCEYTDIDMWTDNLLCVEFENGNYCLVDQAGTIVSDEYSMIWRFYDGVARVQDGTKDGLIDETGALVAEFNVGALDGFSGGLASVRCDGKQGCVDTSGSIVIPCEYDSIRVKLGYAVATKYNTFGTTRYLLDKSNNVLEQEFTVNSGFVFMVILALVLVIAIILFLRRKKKKAQKLSGHPTPQKEGKAAVQKLADSSEKVREQSKAAAQKLMEKVPGIPKGIPCDCGVVNDPKAKFCSGCGKPVQAPGRCPSCGHQNKAGAKFCQECGKPLDGGEG